MKHKLICGAWPDQYLFSYILLYCNTVQIKKNKWTWLSFCMIYYIWWRIFWLIVKRCNTLYWKLKYSMTNFMLRFFNGVIRYAESWNIFECKYRFRRSEHLVLRVTLLFLSSSHSNDCECKIWTHVWSKNTTVLSKKQARWHIALNMLCYTGKQGIISLFKTSKA